PQLPLPSTRPAPAIPTPRIDVGTTKRLPSASTLRTRPASLTRRRCPPRYLDGNSLAPRLSLHRLQAASKEADPQDNQGPTSRSARDSWIVGWTAASVDPGLSTTDLA